MRLNKFFLLSVLFVVSFFLSTALVFATGQGPEFTVTANPTSVDVGGQPPGQSLITVIMAHGEGNDDCYNYSACYCYVVGSSNPKIEWMATGLLDNDGNPIGETTHSFNSYTLTDKSPITETINCSWSTSSTTGLAHDVSIYINPPVVDFYQIPLNSPGSSSSNPLPIPHGDVTLKWTATNADYCVLPSEPNNHLPTSSQIVVTPPNYTSDYSITCYGPGGGPGVTGGTNKIALDTVYVTPVNSKPDLIASSPTPVAAVVGVPTIFHSTITNQGNADTDYQGIRTFTNLFQTATGFDDAFNPINLTDFSAGPMDTIPQGGETIIASRSITFSSVGTNWIRACADKSSAGDQGTINESLENNNCSSPWTPVTISLTAKPDLIASNPTSTDLLPIIAGVPKTFSSTITNQGTAATNYQGINSFPNLFQTSTLPNGGGTVTDYPVVPNMTTILAGGTKITTKSITFSTNGTYYLRACADKLNQNDGGGAIIESNEGNNCSASWTTIAVGNPALPDLTAGGITPILATVGVNTTFSATISNIGTASTGTSFHNFAQISTDQGITFIDLPAILMTPLGAGQNKIMSMSHKFTSSGTYYARVCANKLNHNTFDNIVESDYSNNCGPLTGITVIDPNGNMSVDLSALPMFILLSPGDIGTTILTWTVTGTPDTCSATGDWSGAKAAANGSHTESISNLDAGPPSPHTYTFNITCKKTGVANAFASVSVNVLENNGKPVDAQCGLTHYDCTLGTYDGAGNNNGTDWLWTCNGVNGGKDASCSESMGGLNECSNPLYTNYPKCDTCLNGGTYPKCADACSNPLYTNYPKCDVCVNGETYPACIGTGGSSCSNSLYTNYPLCDVCVNGEAYPACIGTGGSCINPLYTNYPSCNACKNGQTFPVCKKVPGYIER